MRNIISAYEDIHYLWRKAHTFSLNEIHSWVLWAYLPGTDDMLHGVQMILLAGIEYPHRYCWYASRVLTIFPMGNGYPYECWISSKVLPICLKGTDDIPHGQWISSQVLKIVYTRWSTSRREEMSALKIRSKTFTAPWKWDFNLNYHADGINAWKNPYTCALRAPVIHITYQSFGFNLSHPLETVNFHKKYKKCKDSEQTNSIKILTWSSNTESLGKWSPNLVMSAFFLMSFTPSRRFSTSLLELYKEIENIR